MIINQWVPAAHAGDAIGDSARRVRDMLRSAGHESDLFALTMDDELQGEVRMFSDPDARRGDVTIFHFALPSPMTESFATLDGARVLQYTSRRRRSSRHTTPACSGSRRSDGRNCARWSAASTWRWEILISTVRNSRVWVSPRRA